VKPEEHKVSLVVEGGDLPTHKLRVVWEEGGKHAADAVTQAGAEVVQDHLWGVFSRLFASPLRTVENMLHYLYCPRPIQKVLGSIPNGSAVLVQAGVEVVKPYLVHEMHRLSQCNAQCLTTVKDETFSGRKTVGLMLGHCLPSFPCVAVHCSL
jgi:hypothetical protein